MPSDHTYSFSGVITTFTVAATGDYEITAYGAQGGSVRGFAGGYGAEVQGTFHLTQGEVLEILVGGAAPSGTYRGAGGGGGSFVVAEPAEGSGFGTPLVIAGGGGGAYYLGGAYNSGGGAGQIGTSGEAGGNSPRGGLGSSGGSNGGGGAGRFGRGGGGYTGNGGGRYGGQSFRAGGAGGAYYSGPGNGGFGGGGYGYNGGGGGGGGYSGGGGGYNHGGGGGGSFDGGSNQMLIAGQHSGNGLVTIDLLCYLRGTHILTPTGEAFVEDLKIGDLVVTRFGGLQPIKWIGRQSYDARFVKDNREHLPVCIRAGALGDRLPARDLYVSPGHAMLVGSTLVLASSLVNGLTITQDWSPSVIDYFQIELASHDCVIAEGTWSETFADGPGLRERFHNAAEFAELYPDHAPPDEVRLCAPRPLSGSRLAAALLPLVERTGAGIPPGPLRGAIDAIRPPFTIDCWAQDTSHPFLPVLLEVLLGDVVIASVLACDHRSDLEQAGIGHGRASVSLTSPVRLKPELLRTLRIRRASDHTELPMTPACSASIGVEADEDVAHGPDLRLVG